MMYPNNIAFLIKFAFIIVFVIGLLFLSRKYTRKGGEKK